VASETAQANVQNFKLRVRELGLQDSVLWAGRLSKEDMRSFYADITLAVTTHRNEGFGIWILEALAMERPVVALHEGGVRDPLEGCPAGVLVNSMKQMADEILRLSHDRPRFEKMADSGPDWVRSKFGRDRMIDNYHSLFKTLSKDSDASPHSTNGKRLNILQIISKNDRYGAQRIFLDQVAILHRMGHNVVVAGRGDTGYVSDSVRTLGVEYHGIPMNGVRDIIFLRQLIKKYPINVMHTTLDRADYVGVILSKMTGVPVVSTMMVPRYHVGFRFADRVVVLSNKQKELLLQKNIRPEKILVIRPGINVERFANPDPEKREAWRGKLKADDYGLVFCHIASIIPRKAHKVSIDLVHECKIRGENPLLIIIGDPLSGEYYESLVQKIADLGLERNVRFTGWTSEIPEILSLSHFTILPSENEALGIVLMEGMAAGTPIIAREGEGGAELIEEYGTGYLFSETRSLGSLAEQISMLRKDSVRYSRLSGHCREIGMERFSLSTFGRRLSDLYGALCN
ncbi:MAG TPA: hypothetical protein DCS42_02755, partial [Nitrospiraceae bacterium]|nr:hypothetical protein [Nitrospiraceae bacterium]